MLISEHIHRSMKGALMPTPEKLRLVVVNGTNGNGLDCFDLHSNQCLHGEESDRHYHKNVWDRNVRTDTLRIMFRDVDSDFYRQLITRLMQNDTGVETVKVTKYTFSIMMSRAVPREAIYDIIRTVGEDLDLF